MLIDTVVIYCILLLLLLLLLVLLLLLLLLLLLILLLVLLLPLLYKVIKIGAIIQKADKTSNNECLCSLNIFC